MPTSTRKQPEPRVELANAVLRLDFDPRTSDTMYNYIHVRRPDSGRWERVYNFGVDVRVVQAGKPQNEIPGGVINAIGMALDLRVDGRRATVRYPEPLVQYRQFDDKIGSAETVRKYPDFTLAALPGLVHADASAEFIYELDASRPSFVVTGKALGGPITDITCILDALWTDNHACPTHEYIEGFPEWDIARPESVLARMVGVENVAFALFYRHDGNGLPFALLPLEPGYGEIHNFYDNWKCDADFREASRNQAYCPERPVVTGCNDGGYFTRPKADGRFAGVRVAFFPELAWLRGGSAHILRERLVEAIRRDYFDAAASWDRYGKYLQPKLTLTGSIPR